MPTRPFPIDLTRLLAPYKGEWVALSSDETRILGHGKTIEETLALAKGKEEARPLLIKVPDDEGAGFVLI
jgi:hypothetical protein